MSFRFGPPPAPGGDLDKTLRELATVSSYFKTGPTRPLPPQPQQPRYDQDDFFPEEPRKSDANRQAKPITSSRAVAVGVAADQRVRAMRRPEGKRKGTAGNLVPASRNYADIVKQAKRVCIGLPPNSNLPPLDLVHPAQVNGVFPPMGLLEAGSGTERGRGWHGFSTMAGDFGDTTHGSNTSVFSSMGSGIQASGGSSAGSSGASNGAQGNPMAALQTLSQLGLPPRSPEAQDALRPWREVRVYISSTFVDTQGERRALVGSVFPRLNEELFPLRVRLVPVVLGYGSAPEIRPSIPLTAVFDEIDRCRSGPEHTPWMIVLRTERYGIIPRELPDPQAMVNHEVSHDEYYGSKGNGGGGSQGGGSRVVPPCNPHMLDWYAQMFEPIAERQRALEKEIMAQLGQADGNVNTTSSANLTADAFGSSRGLSRNQSALNMAEEMGRLFERRDCVVNLVGVASKDSEAGGGAPGKAGRTGSSAQPSPVSASMSSSVSGSAASLASAGSGPGGIGAGGGAGSVGGSSSRLHALQKGTSAIRIGETTDGDPPPPLAFFSYQMHEIAHGILSIPPPNGPSDGTGNAATTDADGQPRAKDAAASSLARHPVKAFVYFRDPAPVFSSVDTHWRWLFDFEYVPEGAMLAEGDRWQYQRTPWFDRLRGAHSDLQHSLLTATHACRCASYECTVAEQPVTSGTVRIRDERTSATLGVRRFGDGGTSGLEGFSERVFSDLYAAVSSAYPSQAEFVKRSAPPGVATLVAELEEDAPHDFYAMGTPRPPVSWAPAVKECLDYCEGKAIRGGRDRNIPMGVVGDPGTGRGMFMSAVFTALGGGEAHAVALGTHQDISKHPSPQWTVESKHLSRAETQRALLETHAPRAGHSAASSSVSLSNHGDATGGNTHPDGIGGIRSGSSTAAINAIASDSATGAGADDDDDDGLPTGLTATDAWSVAREVPRASRVTLLSGQAFQASVRARALRLRATAAQRRPASSGTVDVEVVVSTPVGSEQKPGSRRGSVMNPAGSSRRGSVFAGAGGPGAPGGGSAGALLFQRHKAGGGGGGVSPSLSARRDSVLSVGADGSSRRGSSQSSAGVAFGEKPLTHHLVAYHNCAADPPRSRSLTNMISRFFRLVLDAFAIDDMIVPSRPHEILEKWPALLDRCASRGRLIFLVDSVDHLSPHEHAQSLHWIPNPLPTTVRFVVATSPSHPSHPFLSQHRPTHIVSLPSFLGDKETQRSVVSALECAGVSLGADALQILLGKRDSGVGGYAQIAAAGLAAVPRRVRDEFLSELPRTLPGAATFVLQVIERVHGADLVRVVVTALLVSRDGLSEAELAALVDFWQSTSAGRSAHPSTLSAVLRPLRPLLTSLPPHGRLRLGWSAVERAVRERYLTKCPLAATGTCLDAVPGGGCRHIGPRSDDWELCEGSAHALAAKYCRARADPGGMSKWDGDDPRAMSLLVRHAAFQRAGGLAELGPLLGDLRYLRKRVELTSVPSILEDFVECARVFGELGPVGPVQHFVRSRLGRLSEIAGEVRDAPLLQAALDLPLGHVLHTQARSMLQQMHSRNAMPYVEWLNKPGKMDPCVQVLRGHSGAVRCVHLAPDPASSLAASANANSKSGGAHSGSGGDAGGAGAGGTNNNNDTGNSSSSNNNASGGGGGGSSSGGLLCVTGGEDGTVRVFNPVSGDMRDTLRGHKGPVQSVEANAAGLIASGGADAKVLVWELGGTSPMLTLTGHTGSVNGVRWSPSGRVLATCADDMLVQVWDVHQRRVSYLTRNCGGHTGAITSVTYSKDGSLVISSSKDNTVQLRDAETGTLKGTIQRVSRSEIGVVNCARMSRAQDFILCGCDDGVVRLYRRSDLELETEYPGHEHAVTGVDISPDGNFLISTSIDGTVRLWDKELQTTASDPTPKPSYRLLDGHRRGVTSAAFSSNGQYAAAGGRDRTVRVWARQGWVNALRGGRVKSLMTLGDPGGPMRDEDDGINDDDNNDHAGAADDANGGGGGGDGAGGDRAGRAGHATNPNAGGKYGAVTNSGDVDCHGGWVTAIAFSSDSHKVVSGCADGIARSFSLQWGSFLHAFEGHQAAVTAVAWVQKRVVTASDDKTVRCWNAENGQILHLIEGHTGPVLAVAMHPNARFIASGGESNLVALVDSLKKQNIVVQRTMLGHRKAVIACAVLDNAPALGGRDLVVASVSRDNLVAVWDGHTCDMLTSFSCVTPSRDGDGRAQSGAGGGTAPESYDAIANRSWVTSLDISKDGGTLVTGSTDMHVVVWEIAGFANRVLRILKLDTAVNCVRFAIMESGFTVAGASGGSNDPDRSAIAKATRRGTAASGSTRPSSAGGGSTGSGLGGPGGGPGSATSTVPIYIALCDSTARMWDGHGRILTYRGHETREAKAQESPDEISQPWVFGVSPGKGGRIATASEDGTGRVWDAASGTTTEEETPQHSSEITSAAAEGDIVITAGRDEIIRVWDFTGRLITKLISDSPVLSCALDSTGKTVLFGCQDHHLYKWSRTRADEPPVRVGSHDRGVGACAFSRKGTIAISGCGRSTDFDGISAKVWVLLTGECVTLTGHSRGISAVTFSPDSQFAITASLDRTIRTWNAMTGGMVASMTDPALGPVSSVTVSLDGQRILSGGREGSLFLWSRKSGRLLCQRSDVHGGGVRAVSFSSDGRRIVSCGNDGAVRWWAANGHAITAKHQWHAWPAQRGDKVSAMTAIAVDKTFTKVLAGDAGGNAYFLRVMRI